MLRLLKWLENHETSVFLSLKGFNYCLLLEFSQVVYYNEGAISRSAPIFRDFQAIFPGTVSTWPMFRHFQAILLPKGFSARFVEGMEPLERAMVYNRWRIELTCEACLAAWWRREM